MDYHEYKYPEREQWRDIVERPHRDPVELGQIVGDILKQVKARGDAALYDYEEKLDRVKLNSLEVTSQEFDEAEKLVSSDLKEALTLAHHNIAKFHEAQRFESQEIETCKGVVCWQKAMPIENVGLYVPGGSAPLFSTVLMLATPAQIAGCRNIVLCTPPNREGKVNPAILVAARIAGVNHIYKVGGAQAVAAMAYGTESVPKVDKIFGPGNQFVMAAKQAVSVHDVAIDMPAGPSEVCVVADATSNPQYVAADLLSQAEHGPDSQVVLISMDETMLRRVEEQLDVQLPLLPRHEIAEKSLQNSKFILVHNAAEAMMIANAYAPEHLIIAVDDYEVLASQVQNAGSVFLGHYACESAGDYASGTNHTLPTSGYARAYSGVNLDSFQRKITFQHLTEDGVRSIGETVALMAENEQLMAHCRAMQVRMENL